MLENTGGMAGLVRIDVLLHVLLSLMPEMQQMQRQMMENKTKQGKSQEKGVECVWGEHGIRLAGQRALAASSSMTGSTS